MIREMDDFARAVEAALFASEEPLTPAELRAHVGDGGDLPATLAGLAQDYAGRGVNLVERGGRWHFQTAADLAALLMLPGTMFQPEGSADGKRQIRIAFANADASGIAEMFRRLAGWQP